MISLRFDFEAECYVTICRLFRYSTLFRDSLACMQEGGQRSLQRWAALQKAASEGVALDRASLDTTTPW